MSATKDQQQMKPVLQKPPGFKDPNKPLPRLPLPLRKSALPPSFHPTKSRRNVNFSRLCCCIAIIIILFLILLLILLSIFIYLWFDPKLPQFHLQSFKISSFNVSSKVDGTYLNAAAIARLEVKNPNSKLTYRYGDSEVEMTLGKHQGTQLGSTALGGFVQRERNTTSLKIQTSVKNELVEDRVGSRIKSQFKSKALIVNVHFKTKIGVDADGVKIGMLGVDVFCGGIVLKHIDGGDMPKCSIHTLKWININ